jgi:hypothetical protein
VGSSPIARSIFSGILDLNFETLEKLKERPTTSPTILSAQVSVSRDDTPK